MVANFFYLYFSILFSLLAFNGVLGIDLIYDTCNKSAAGDANIKYDFCVRSFEYVPKSHIANLRGLGRISMHIAISNATHTVSYIEKLLEDQKTMDPYVKSCLEDCMELYSDAIDDLKTAIDNFNKQNYSDANIQLSAAIDSPVTCEDGFHEKKGVASPLTHRNDDLFELAAISLSITNMCSSYIV